MFPVFFIKVVTNGLNQIENGITGMGIFITDFIVSLDRDGSLESGMCIYPWLNIIVQFTYLIIVMVARFRTKTCNVI